jgi:hypothetical protein
MYDSQVTYIVHYVKSYIARLTNRLLCKAWMLGEALRRARLELAMQHTITQVIAHQSSVKNIACGDGTNLECYSVMAATGDFIMTIITIGYHYSMWSCRPTPQRLSVACGQHANSGGSSILAESCLVEARSSRCPEHKLLVGLRRMNAYHTARPDPNTGQS